MTDIRHSERHWSRWRIAAWAMAALVLLLPAVAMQFTDEVNWSFADFAIAGMLIGGAGLTYEAAARASGNVAYRAGVGVALAAAFLLIWINLAVGIVGTEENPANLMFGGVLAVAIVGAVVARFRPDGMACAMVATALAQALVAAIVTLGGIIPAYNSVSQILAINAFFLALWLLSAWLFRRSAARG